MTVAPSPYQIARALQDMVRAQQHVIDLLVPMLDKSAPDPFLSALSTGPMREGDTRDIPLPPRSRRVSDDSGRPSVLMMIRGVEVKTTKRRAVLLGAVMANPMTLVDMMSEGIAPTVAGVKAQIIDTNRDLENAGLDLRVRMQALPAQRRGSRGGRLPALYALLGPKDKVAPQAVQSEGSVDASLADPALANEHRFIGYDGVRLEAGSRVSSDLASEIAGEPTSINSGQMNRLPDQGPVGREECKTAQLGPSTCDEPSGASAGSDVRVVAPFITGKEKALDLWATTDLSKRDIAERVKCQVGSIDGYLSKAKAACDPRATPPHRKAASVAEPVLPRPQPVRQPIEPGDLLAVDIKFGRVTTKAGVFDVSGANMARTLDLMKGSLLFGLDVIAKKAGWQSAEVARQALQLERPRLAAHGIDLFLDKVNARLRVAS